MHAFVTAHYEVASVDVGRFDRNLAIPLRLGMRGRAMFVSAIIVVDPRERRVVNHGEETTLAGSGTMNPQAVLDRWAVGRCEETNSMLRTTLTIAAAALTLAAAPTSATVKAPVVRGSFDQIAKPLPLPYDGAASADAQIAAARARAIRSHRRLLIDLGGNWCLDCRLLAGTMELPALRGFVARHYEVVTVDIGRFDKNGQVWASYGGNGRLAGVPALLIVDPHSNRLLNKGSETALADARSMSPQGLADYLARWAG